MYNFAGLPLPIPHGSRIPDGSRIAQSKALRRQKRSTGILPVSGHAQDGHATKGGFAELCSARARFPNTCGVQILRSTN
jgi:hypothetical protein